MNSSKMMIALCMSAVTALYAGKEIELKIRVADESYAKIESWLTDNPRASYLHTSNQEERYVNNPKESTWDYSLGFKDSLKTLRVRKEEKGDSFCYKFRHLDPATGKTTHRDEEEVAVSSGDTMIKILENLGFTEHTAVVKTRVTYMVEDIFELVFDDVAGIGKFIEIELKDGTENPKAGIAKIEDLLKRMGVLAFTKYDRGYIHMMWNPGYNFGEEVVLEA